MAKDRINPSRWLKPLLMVSLGINLIVAGLIIGIMSRAGPPPRGSIPAQDMVGFLTSNLPDSFRRDVRRQLIRHRRDLVLANDRIGELRQEVFEALIAEPFDINALEQILTRERGRFVVLGEQSFTTLIDAIAQLSKEQRSEYAQNLKNHPQ